jgi:hypothetical protein
MTKLAELQEARSLSIRPPYAFVAASNVPGGSLFRCKLPCGDVALEPLVSEAATAVVTTATKAGEGTALYIPISNYNVVHTCKTEGCRSTPDNLMSLPPVGITLMAADDSFVAVVPYEFPVFGCALGSCDAATSTPMVFDASTPELKQLTIGAGRVYVGWHESMGDVIASCPTSGCTSPQRLQEKIPELAALRAYGEYLYFTQRPVVGEGFEITRCRLPDCPMPEKVGTVANETPFLLAIDACGVVVASRPIAGGPSAPANIYACYGLNCEKRLVAAQQANPSGLELDPSGIYWTNNKSTDSFMRAAR